MKEHVEDVAQVEPYVDRANRKLRQKHEIENYSNSQNINIFIVFSVSLKLLAGLKFIVTRIVFFYLFSWKKKFKRKTIWNKT